MDDPSAEEEFDLVVAQLADRMAEYLAALREIRNVDAALKADLWNAAITKRDEINYLNARLAELGVDLRARALPESPARRRGRF